MECRIKRIRIQSGYQKNANVRCKTGLGLFPSEKRSSETFLRFSGAESQPSLLVPVTEAYCCNSAATSVTQHSCLLIWKTEMLKGKVRWARERTNEHKITRCGKEGEEYWPLLQSDFLISRVWSKSSLANKNIHATRSVINTLLCGHTLGGITPLKFNNGRRFPLAKVKRVEENNLAALIWLSERMSSPIRACNPLRRDGGAAALCC